MDNIQNKKNVLIIIHKLNGGGAERCASNLSLELSKFHNVYLACFDCRNMTYPYGGTLLNLNIKDSSNSYNRLLGILRRVKKLRYIKKKYGIEYSISLLDGPNIANVLSSRGEKTIVSVRNCLSKEPMTKLRRKLIHFTSIKSDVTVALSKYVGKDLADNFNIPNNKIEVIYNHCDASLLEHLAKNSKLDIELPKGFNYITMGRLNRQKGQWHLLRSFKEVLKKFPNSNLLIFGEGELRAKLEKLSLKLGIKQHIYFYGYIENPHIYMKLGDCFVFPSLYEGLGNVLLEAFAMGLPIISTDCEAGPREILAPDTQFSNKTTDIEYCKFGILCPVMDENNFNADSPLTDEEIKFSEAMVMMQVNQELCQDYRRKAHFRISDFNKEYIIQKWNQLLIN